MPDSIAEILEFRAGMPITSVYAKVKTVWPAEKKPSQWGDPYNSQNLVLRDDDGCEIVTSLTSQDIIPESTKGQMILLLPSWDSKTGKDIGLERGEYNRQRDQFLVRQIKVSGRARVIVAPEPQVLNDLLGYGTAPAPGEQAPVPGPVAQPQAKPLPGRETPAQAREPRPQAPAEPEARSIRDLVNIYFDCYMAISEKFKDFSVEQLQRSTSTVYIEMGRKTSFRVDPWLGFVEEQPEVEVVQSQAPPAQESAPDLELPF